jgi:hypothetical protein
MARYAKKAQQKVRQAMHERKRGSLRSGRSGRKVKSRKQAIAIGLSQARRAGAKVPPAAKKSAAKKSRKRPAKRGGKRSAPARKSAPRKTGNRRPARRGARKK